jgi:hypothetical protein
MCKFETNFCKAIFLNNTDYFTFNFKLTVPLLIRWQIPVVCIEQSAGHLFPAARKFNTPEKIDCNKSRAVTDCYLGIYNWLVVATLEIGDPVIAFLDVTDRTSFRKLGCIVATLRGTYYTSIFILFYFTLLFICSFL